ncbi:MAG: hypothetical protein E7K04_00810 [Helicobacter sp.]|nr:hypothetical protein [Helicobacter sp.]
MRIFWFLIMLFAPISPIFATSLSEALTQRDMLGTWRIIEVRIDGAKLKKVDKNYSFIEFKPSSYALSGKYHTSLGCDRFFGRYQLLEQGYLVINKGGTIEESCKNDLSRSEMLKTQIDFMTYFFGRFKMSRKDGFFLLENPRLEIWMIPYKNIEDFR